MQINSLGSHLHIRAPFDECGHHHNSQSKFDLNFPFDYVVIMGKKCEFILNIFTI